MSSERLIYEENSFTQGTLVENGIKIPRQSLKHSQDNEKNSFFASCLSTSQLEEGLSEYVIKFEDILWCEELTNKSDIQQACLQISFVSVITKKHKLESITVNVSKYNQGKSTADMILQNSYRNNMLRPSILVLINPHGGQGKAIQIYKSKILPVLKAAKVNITYLETKYYQHGIEIARELNVDDYDIIACCSGDGIPHEVINGFYSRPDKGLNAFNKIAVTQLPCGSGNAFSLSTHGSNDPVYATLSMLKAKRTKLDLMAVTQGIGNKTKISLSFLTQCYGIIADSDIGTEHLRWMGPIRFDLGVAQKVFRRAKYPCDIYVKYSIQNKGDLLDHFNENYKKDVTVKPLTIESFETTAPTLNEPVPSDWVKIPNEISSNINILYVGKMPYISNDVQFFPAALPNDGKMDMIITDTNTSLKETTSILLSLDKGLHVHKQGVHHSKILGYRLIPKLNNPKNHYLSVDGESFPFEPLQVEVLPHILTALLPAGNFVETSFSK